MALPETVVLDTSVLVRFFVPYADEDQPRAEALRDGWLDDRVQLVQLDLSVYEFVNAVTRSLGHGSEQAAREVGALYRLQMPIVPVDNALAVEAARLAADLGLSGYDAAFVAAARRLGVPLVTCDRRLAASADEALLLTDLAA